MSVVVFILNTNAVISQESSLLSRPFKQKLPIAIFDKDLTANLLFCSQPWDLGMAFPSLWDSCREQ